MKRAALTGSAAALAALSILLSVPAAGSAAGNPCMDKRARELLCPDLRVGRPNEMYVDREVRPGRVVLRATNDIQSRGTGPMELHGHLYKPRWMHVQQAIYRKAGGRRFFPSKARLHFFDVGYQYGGAYWKVQDPLRFELWKVGGRGRKLNRVRVGPKQFYCFRDLERTLPGPLSPQKFFYPPCDQSPNTRDIVLGTSVGWSDVYPSTYDLQWIDVTGLARGCYAYLLRVDPLNRFHESDEENNVSQRLVRLPYRPGPQRCV